MILKNFDLKKKVFIIAEIGNNHEGNFNNAKKMVELAAKAGVDAVKFQTFKTENFIRKTDKKRFKQLKKFELSYKNFKSLKDIAHKNKLKFISTPLDMDSADFLTVNADLIKISSGDNNFFPLIDKILKTKKKMIISCGMMNINQVKDLEKYINKIIGKKEATNRVAFLHCVTSYPVENEYANLNSIKFMKKKINLTIGYSDHTVGVQACLAAVALGANILEKHFTHDKNFSSFRDHHLSSDFDELKSIVDSVRILENQLGQFNKKIEKPEHKLIKMVRRAPYAKKNILVNERLSLENTVFLRPASSKNFLNLKKVIGKKTKNKFSKDKIIKLNT
tara:strand:- start:1845 stop:2849 length:1005 start_codon:yes stop_codon:yes gene_type:complete